jgi:hypothetical protein
MNVLQNRPHKQSMLGPQLIAAVDWDTKYRHLGRLVDFALQYPETFVVEGGYIALRGYMPPPDRDNYRGGPSRAMGG